MPEQKYLVQLVSDLWLWINLQKIFLLFWQVFYITNLTGKKCCRNFRFEQNFSRRKYSWMTKILTEIFLFDKLNITTVLQLLLYFIFCLHLSCVEKQWYRGDRHMETSLCTWCVLWNLFYNTIKLFWKYDIPKGCWVSLKRFTLHCINSKISTFWADLFGKRLFLLDCLDCFYLICPSG